MLGIVIAFLVGSLVGSYLTFKITQFAVLRSIADGTFEQVLNKHGLTVHYNPGRDQHKD